MEQEVLYNFQKLQLTKEEADDIVITSVTRAELLEECSLSLFGRLLTDRQQNQRAFKNTLKAAWKMGSDLRIVEVGNNVFQFKFGTVCQLEWVERSVPWNFDNNLLLLCRWRKGLTASNISFSHAPFWVQVWGLPFEYMSEDAGKDIGGRLGKVLEVDKRSLQAEQAKFMRIRVEIPIDKPLRRGGNITNTEGERCSIIFRYECLPTFCYMCGILGHDEKHCHVSSIEGVIERQYGDWLRAGGVVRNGNDKGKGVNEGSSEGVAVDRNYSRPGSSVANPGPSALSKDCGVGGWDSNSGLTKGKAVNSANLSKDLNPILSVGDGLTRWDKADGAVCGLQVEQKTQLEGNGTCWSLVGEQLKPGDEARSDYFKKDGPCNIEPEMASPVKANKEAIKDPSLNGLGPNLEAEKEPISKGKWKKIAREKGKAQEVDMKLNGPEVGNKRVGCIEDLLIAECRSQKKVLGGERSNNDSNSLNETAVTARQHRREK